MQRIFVHPYTKRFLEKDSEGNLFCLEGNRRDVFKCYNGCYDFAVANPSVRETRDVYDETYTYGKTYELTLAKVAEPWFDGTFPWRRTMLENLGTLSGRNVLLLGNGMSFKEFYFLHLGARVVFTDLSLLAVMRVQSLFRRSELFVTHREHIEFHAVDAMYLPFPDESFDVIYGSKFVPFLDNLAEFFSEVRRCLKPGGLCRFSDDAFSPALDGIRRKLWRPIKSCFIRNSKTSLASIRSASTFGFMEESFTPFIEQFGFRRLVFIREFFFLRIAQLCWGTLVQFDSRRLRYAKPLYLAMKRVDNWLANTTWMRRNRLALTWGFDK